MKTFRLREMEQYILEQGTVSMVQLKDHFQISMNTVRADVATLVKKGTICKVYGGVCSNQKGSLIPFDERKEANVLRKQSVAKEAASMIEDGDIIFLDSGTTTMYVIDYMKDCKNVTVLTSNLNAINRTLAVPEVNVICLPGVLERDVNAFVSADAVRMLERYNIRKAFMASAGVTKMGTVTNSSPLEYEIKKAAIANSQEKVLLIDSSKYGRSALMTYANLSEMDRLIVDEGGSRELLDRCVSDDVLVSVTKIEEE